MKPFSKANDGVQRLDIAVGLKQLLMDADITPELIISMGYQHVSEMLHIDQYVGKLIVEAAQNAIQERNLDQDLSNFTLSLAKATSCYHNGNVN